MSHDNNTYRRSKGLESGNASARGASRGPHRAAVVSRPVLGPASDALRYGLEIYPDILQKVLPLSAKHRRLLPEGVKHLSAALTSERAGMDAGYLRSAGARAAYLHFFLPWNLFRLGRLLPGLDLPLAPGAVLADLGCGPLTLAQALWLARPDLREVELEFWCVDREKKLMTMGMDLLRGLAEATGGDSRAWRIRMVHAPLEKGLGSLPRSLALMASVNVLNEIRFERRDLLADQVADLAERMGAHVAHSGRMLFVEPGTRLGGKLTSLARAGAQEQGFVPLSPCTHAAECPMLSPRSTSWCHFAADTAAAPEWLKALSRHAGMNKERAALSFACLAAKGMGEGRVRKAFAPEISEDSSAPTPAASDAQPSSDPPVPTVRSSAPFAGRVVSDVFLVPNEDGLGNRRGRYACTQHGLVLVFGDPPSASAGMDPSGARVILRWPEVEERDAKTGLPIARWNAPERPERQQRPAYRDRRPEAEAEARPRRRYPPGSRRRGKKSGGAGQSGQPGQPEETRKPGSADNSDFSKTGAAPESHAAPKSGDKKKPGGPHKKSGPKKSGAARKPGGGKNSSGGKKAGGPRTGGSKTGRKKSGDGTK